MADAKQSLFTLLPDEMRELHVRPLFIMTIEVARPLIAIGKTPGVDRRIGNIPGGHFEGDRLRGIVLPGGSDWQTVRPGDGAWTHDVRLALQTDDGNLISMAYTGIRHGPKDVLERISRGESVNVNEYYLRTTATFETAAEEYGWLNKMVAIGRGHRLKEGPIYHFFEVL